MVRITSFLLLAGAALAAPLHAQQPLRVGQNTAGNLESGDPRMEDGPFYDGWLLQGRPGERVTVRMTSDEFDTMLHAGPAEGAWVPMESNDDAGIGTNSYILVTLDRAGRSLLRASALEAGREGGYRLVTRAWRDPSTTPLTVGRRLSGTLDDNDFTAANGPEDRYTLRGTAGKTVTVSVESSDFDTQLSIGQPVDQAWEELEGNDDRGEGTNSQAVFTFPETGVYQVAVFGFGEGLGAYTVRVEEGDVAEPEGDAGAVTISIADVDDDVLAGFPVEALRPGTPASGELTAAHPTMEDGSHYRDYAWNGRAGEQLTVDLSSDDFDAFLYLGTGSGESFQEIESNDDGGQDRDARLVVTLPRTGTFTIRVNTLGEGATGAYVLVARPRR
jgi:hypothetical protein